ncbi:hypothetical protein PFICI_06940 [Pestalotiopsis fici W106-1]|uniref:Uncharacterized protein n=1 Tax=Pestalotiopsis fici (strain W106-1 / CGMCC3.15140) TaxID=1229662 RepID=W3X748_PESFW|nr:uncharacterized protein PFICI_06940 [Pestalotiopsis fici W106-1]ETS81938.1 hypothetical protein PFICI_06940 [Pestalotiopsis fici W106-1]
MASSQNTTSDTNHGTNHSVTDEPSTASLQRENPEASDNDLINLRLAAFLNESMEHGNRNVMLPDQTADPSVTIKKAEASMAKKLQAILGCCNIQ